MQKQNRKTLWRLCACAVLIALFVVLDLFSMKIGNDIKITFGGLPILIAGILFGPLPGAVVGLCGSFLGQLMSYGLSATTVLWILPAGIRGLLAGLLYRAFGQKDTPWILGAQVILSSLCVTALNTLAQYLDACMVGYPFAATLPTLAFRVASSVITSVFYVVLIYPILRILRKRNL